MYDEQLEKLKTPSGVQAGKQQYDLYYTKYTFTLQAHFLRTKSKGNMWPKEREIKTRREIIT
jgi:hypothetical protein